MKAEADRAFDQEASGKTLGVEGAHAEYRGDYGASWLRQVPSTVLGDLQGRTFSKGGQVRPYPRAGSRPLF